MHAKITPLVVALSFAAACSGSPPTETTPSGVGTPGDPPADAEPPPVTVDPDAGPAPNDTSTPTEDVAQPPPSDTDSVPDTTSPSCGEPPAEPPSTPPTKVPADPYPYIRHWESPTVESDVALTFDDGPNPETTNKILDILKAENIRATFFINTRVSNILKTSSEAQETLKRTIAEGHVIGNHTGEHLDLTLSSTDVEAQLRAVEDDVKVALPCAPPLTLVRAPFGEPYLSGTESAKNRVLPLVAKHGVHIGWTIESRDWTCADGAGMEGPGCVLERVLYRIDLGKRGAILLHDTEPVTVEALPQLIAELKKRGVTFVTAEKLVRDKYGKPSSALLK